MLEEKSIEVGDEKVNRVGLVKSKRSTQVVKLFDTRYRQVIGPILARAVIRVVVHLWLG